MAKTELTPEQIVNDFVNRVFDKVGYGKQQIFSSEDVKELMYDIEEEMFPKQK